MIFKKTFLALFLLQASCSSMGLKQKINKLKLGQTKSHIVETLGSPKFSYRKQGKQHWIYEFYQNQTRQQQTLIFLEGTLVKKAPLIKDIDLLNRAAASDSIDEYETHIQTYKKTKDL